MNAQTRIAVLALTAAAGFATPVAAQDRYAAATDAYIAATYDPLPPDEGENQLVVGGFRGSLALRGLTLSDESMTGVRPEDVITAPGSLWLVSAGGVRLGNVTLLGNRVYRFNRNRQPVLTPHFQYSLWVSYDTEMGLYQEARCLGRPHYRLPAGALARVLAAGPTSNDATKVQIGGPAGINGYVLGLWTEMRFMKRKPGR